MANRLFKQKNPVIAAPAKRVLRGWSSMEGEASQYFPIKRVKVVGRRKYRQRN